jgi:hypothetical protein
MRRGKESDGGGEMRERERKIESKRVSKSVSKKEGKERERKSESVRVRDR